MIDQIESFISWPWENNQLVSMLQNGASFAMGYFVQLLLQVKFLLYSPSAVPIFQKPNSTQMFS